ncbi:MAG: ferredoxin-type protein NapF [Pseudomonadales bacterium]|nr:ferredoxin-type protein NapF [Pseudomonadales bacterium]
MDLSRRRFLQGALAPQQSEAIRLPWTISESRFTAGCTRCGVCITVCPQQIIKAAEGGFPALDFSERECTFCGKCTESCEQPLFDPTQAPWQQTARIDDNCLTNSGIVCQNCKDACSPGAIRFQFGLGGIAMPDIEADICNGCGACVAPCPTGSIKIDSTTEEMSVPL